MLEQIHYPQARQMALQGATRGMILKELRAAGVTEAVAERTAERALLAALRVRRWRSAGVLGLGLATLAVAIGCWQFGLRKLAFTAGMFALILSGLGGSGLFQRLDR